MALAVTEADVRPRRPRALQADARGGRLLGRVVWALPDPRAGAGSGRGESRRPGPAGQGRRRLQPGALAALRRPGDPGGQGLPRRRDRRRIRRRRAAGPGGGLLRRPAALEGRRAAGRGDELSLREAAELEPRRADIAVALGRARLRRGAEDEALEAVERPREDFAAGGIAARVQLAKAGVAADAFAALDRGERDAALDSLLAELEAPNGNGAGRATRRPSAT